MSVSDGQKVNAAVTNAAFMSRTVDTSTAGEVDLNSASTASGTQISNSQREHNSIASYVGKAVNTAKDLLPTWLSDVIGSPNQTVKDRVDSVQGSLETNNTETADVRTVTGTATNDTDMGTFTGGLLSDGLTIKALLQEIEDALEPITDALDLQGLWDASTNTPTIVSSTGTKGHFYIVSVAGSTTIDGISSWSVGDWILFDGSVWVRVDNNDAVSSVFSRTGAVVAQANDYTWAQIDKTVSTIDDIADVETSTAADGEVLTWVNANSRWENVVPSAGGGGGNNSSLLENVGISTGVASNILTINLKQKDAATDPTGGSPVEVAFRGTTLGLGDYDTITATTALPISIPAGGTLGHRNGVDELIFVYLIDNAGTMDIGVSSRLLDEGVLHSTTSVSASSDDSGLYANSTLSNKAIRLVARLTSNQATAGQWITPISEVVLATNNVITMPPEYLSVSLATSFIQDTTADNYIDVTGMSLVLGPYRYQIGYSCMFGIQTLGGTSTANVNLAISDSSNNIENGTLGGAGDNALLSTSLRQQQCSIDTEIDVTSWDTYKLRARKDQGTGLGQIRLYGESFFGTLTNPDFNSILWARRIV